MRRMAPPTAWLMIGVLSAAVQAAPSLAQFASTRDVRDLVVVGGDLWCATSGGLYRVPLSGGDTTAYRSPDALRDLDLSALVRGSDGYLWLGTRGGFVTRMDIAKERFTAYNSLAYAGWTVECMADHGEYLLVGSQHGLSFFSKAEGAVRYNAKQFGSYASSEVRQVVRYGDTIAVLLEEGVAWVEAPDIRDVNFNDPNVWKTIDTLGVQSITIGSAGLRLHANRVQYSGGVRFDISDTPDLPIDTLRRNGAVVGIFGYHVYRAVETGGNVYVGTQGASIYKLYPSSQAELVSFNSPHSSDFRECTLDREGTLWCSHGDSQDGIGVFRDGKWSWILSEGDGAPGLGPWARVCRRR
jgi:ligand-binding sensor domain-containing protein